MKRTFALNACVLAATLGLSACAALFEGRGQGWVDLIDGGKGLENWSQVADANWRSEGGAIVADKKTSKDQAFLVSRDTYRDFQIYAEFWVDERANSGIFMRCADATKPTDTNCYEVNIFDQRPDPTYGTGAIVNFAKVIPMPKAAGKWNTYEVTAKGDHLVVMLNGQKTVDIRDSTLKAGPIALQYVAGEVKFRKLRIKPL